MPYGEFGGGGGGEGAPAHNSFTDTRCAIYRSVVTSPIHIKELDARRSKKIKLKMNIFNNCKITQENLFQNN